MRRSGEAAEPSEFGGFGGAAGESGADASAPDSGSGGWLNIPDASSSDSGSGGSGGWALQPGFSAGQKGGWKLGPPLGHGGSGGQAPCASVVRGIVRDFKGYDDGSPKDGHPDFERWCCGSDPDIVLDILGPGRKPEYKMKGSHSLSTDSEIAFEEWYSDTEQSMACELLIDLEPASPGSRVRTFASSKFFPLDGSGFGNFGRDHNFHFTTELHLKWVYKGGETFSFTGDDDVFVFANGRLVLNLGGVHPPESASVDMDAMAAELGVEKGKEYALDFFHAERHTEQSNFKMEAAIDFTDCGTVILKQGRRRGTRKKLPKDTALPKKAFPDAAAAEGCPGRAEKSQAKPSQAKPSQAKPSQAKPSQAKLV